MYREKSQAWFRAQEDRENEIQILKISESNTKAQLASLKTFAPALNKFEELVEVAIFI